MRRALLILAIALAGCGSGDGGSTDTGGPVACTEIGCVNALTVDVSAARSVVPHATGIRVCASGACRTVRAPAGEISLELPAKDSSSVRVTLTVFDHGRAALRTSANARVRKSRPNGPRCEPVCFRAAMTLDGPSLRNATG